MALLDEAADAPTAIDLQDEDRPTQYLDDSEDGRSSFVAFILGGVVITGGLLTFLYYDSNNLQGPSRSDGYLSQLESPIGSTTPRLVDPASGR